MITFPFHVGPDPGAVIAWRHLLDGRVLAAFFDQPVVQRVTHTRTETEFVAGEVIVRLVHNRAEMQTFEVEGNAYFLAITDDDGVPEKWRTLGSRASREEILRDYENFREGDEDRRRAVNPDADLHRPRALRRRRDDR